MTSKALLFSLLNIEFGNDCLSSWDTLIMDTDLHEIHKSNLGDNNGAKINAKNWK
jgi:hypothetical protein